jgi:acyl carrier protein
MGRNDIKNRWGKVLVDDRISIIADVLETDATRISMGKKLSEIPEWDSFGMIKIIAMLDKSYNQRITMDDIKSFIIVDDLISRMK